LVEAVTVAASKGQDVNLKSRMAVLGVALMIGATFVGASSASATDNAQRIQAHFSGHGGVDNPTMVNASGPVSGIGYATQVDTGEAPDGGTGVVTLHFAHGDLVADFNEFNFQMKFNPMACAAGTTSQGTMTVTGGTGAYAGASGALTFTTSGQIVGERGARGECLAMQAPPKFDNVLLVAVGTVSLPTS
jgi:hypothetical protein